MAVRRKWSVLQRQLMVTWSAFGDFQGLVGTDVWGMIKVSFFFSWSMMIYWHWDSVFSVNKSYDFQTSFNRWCEKIQESESRWLFQTFCLFSPQLGKWSNLIIFFKWVGSTTTYCRNGLGQWVTTHVARCPPHLPVSFGFDTACKTYATLVGGDSQILAWQMVVDWHVSRCKNDVDTLMRYVHILSYICLMIFWYYSDIYSNDL